MKGTPLVALAPTSKPFWTSKTFIVNVISTFIAVGGAIVGQDWIAANPGWTASITAALAFANIILRFVTTIPVSVMALMLALLCCSTASAQNTLLVSPERAATLKAYFPPVDDPSLQAILNDPQTILYTEAEIPKVVSMWQGVKGISRRIVAAEDGNDPGSLQFPWMKPAGTDDVKGLNTVRFLHLPTVNGQRQPVVYFRGRIPPDQAAAVQWIFPYGTTVGEVLAYPGPDGLDYPFELRIRYRMQDYWEVDVLRPFATSAELAAAIKERRPQWESMATLASAVRALEGPATFGVARIVDKMPARAVIRQETAWDVVPAIEPKLVAELLRGTRFTSVYETAWKSDGVKVAYAPGTLSEFSIVPPKYSGAAIKVSQQSCARCHSTTLHHVNEFAQHRQQYQDGTLRSWYGRIRGSDGIFSFHPFDPQFIPGGGATVAPVIRQSMVQAGAVAQYNQAIHPASHYRIAHDYDPTNAASSRPMNVVTGSQ